MKRGLLLALTMLIALLCCTAAGERALVNPQEKYDYFVEESDGSEQMLFMMVDLMNDEQSIVEQDGSVLIVQHYLLNDGVTAQDYMQMETRLYVTKCGHVGQYTTFIGGEQQFDLFLTRDYMYQFDESGKVNVDKSSMDSESFEGTWESWIFPFYTPLETLAATRQDEDGYTYFLVISDGGDSLLEYVVSSSGMTLAGMNHYMRGDEDDNYYLWMYTEVVRGEGAEIPVKILQAISENETATPANSPA